MGQDQLKRVFTVAAVPPEECAFALARYSRSPDTIQQSLDWVRTRDSQKFLEHYYFQYGHASIADLGHLVICFEGVSELAATEIEDEPLWDGQARSSRYQDFARSGFVTPAELEGDDAALYQKTAARLLAAYTELHGAMVDALSERLPRPTEMSPGAYQRNIAARAFDVARYLLFFGVATGVGQVTSIRTLERQVRRLKASEYKELNSLADEMAMACASPPDCIWGGETSDERLLAPTLARHVDADSHAIQAREDLRLWAQQNLPPSAGADVDSVDLLRPDDSVCDLVATLLYSVTDRPYRELYELARGWGSELRREVIDVALASRGARDELLRSFRGGPYVYDMILDIGAYRDLHRHRRCHQFRQPYSLLHGYDTPKAVVEAGLKQRYDDAMQAARDAFHALPQPAAQYILPFGTRSRFLFKMDFAEAEYICRLRSGVKGHISYRDVAWRMKCRMEELEPELGRLMQATPPWIEDPLTR